MTAFDFDHAVSAPFRMQPGLRKLLPGQPQLTRISPGSKHQREKLAVLSAFAHEALLKQDGYDDCNALACLCTQALKEHGPDWQWDGHRAHARWLGTAASLDGHVEQTEAGVFGLGDEVARCLRSLPAAWRLAGLVCLSFAEDVAVLDGSTATLPWLAVCLPSHWAPAEKIGRPLAEVHAPVADSALLVKASASLASLATASEPWERFVWNVTANPRLHDHPQHHDADAWRHTTPAQAWWRTERQSFVPFRLPDGRAQALFLIGVQVQPLVQALAEPMQAQQLHDAIASMSPAVLHYRGLSGVREPLLKWLSAQALTALQATQHVTPQA